MKLLMDKYYMHAILEPVPSPVLLCRKKQTQSRLYLGLTFNTFGNQAYPLEPELAQCV